jgi:NADH/NAD ratio-sensing transcriptional regulator Rex
LKENIKPIDGILSDINYWTLLATIIKKETDRCKVGLIAQDVINVCADSLTFSDNSNMKIDQEGDIDGVQLGMDYNTVTVLNVDIIQEIVSSC